MNQDELSKVLELHRKWINNEEGGVKANLSWANLYEANLKGANLKWANLKWANLSWSNLYGANLHEANLYEANLRGTNLVGADLRRANLHEANLYGANLHEANLYGANLSYANLRGVDLKGANLKGANLSWSNLYGANLHEANLHEAVGLGQQVVAGEGVLIGYKKAQVQGKQIVLKLVIPKSARRVNAIGSRKCRCDKAKVLAAFNLDGTPTEETVFYSEHNFAFVYTLGAEVTEPNYDPSDRIECAQGIHFFITFSEAKEY